MALVADEVAGIGDLGWGFSSIRKLAKKATKVAVRLNPAANVINEVSGGALDKAVDGALGGKKKKKKGKAAQAKAKPEKQVARTKAVADAYAAGRRAGDRQQAAPAKPPLYKRPEVVIPAALALLFGGYKLATRKRSRAA